MGFFSKKLRSLLPHSQEKLDDRLAEAAKRGEIETVRTLLADGADVHAGGENALRAAAHDGRTEIVQMLLAAGADIHELDDEALYWAARNGHPETVKMLFANGADVHALDDRALREATMKGHMEIVRIIAKHIFSPGPWRGKTQAEIKAYASTFYEKLESFTAPNFNNQYAITSENLLKAAKILADCALTCWEQVRPPSPKLTISALPARPRPV